METTNIKPSPQARRMFSKMVNLADETMTLPLPQCLSLSVDYHREGKVAEASSGIRELVDQEWIKPSPKGGWKLG